MTSVTSACLCWTLLSICLMVLASDDQKTITAETEQTVTLPCQAPNDKTIKAVEWKRADLGDKYVLFFRDQRLDPENQHPTFKNRVDLLDTQMKGGDVSLILKNVIINDTGTYECRVFVGSWQPINIINLSVLDPPGPPGGSVGLIVGLSVSAVLLLVAFVGVFFIYKRIQKRQGSY